MNLIDVYVNVNGRLGSGAASTAIMTMEQRRAMRAIAEYVMSQISNPARKKALCDRLARVEGQLRGIQNLIQSDADCEQIAQQLAAARKALDKSFFTMVGCVIEQGDLPADQVADMLAKFA